MIRSVLMSALLAAGLAGSATAETITVCANGCDYTSINAAIDVASDGDVIQLSAETYAEGQEVLVSEKSIQLVGTSSRDGDPMTVIAGNGTHRLLQFLSPETSGSLVTDISFRHGNSSPDPSGGGAIFTDWPVQCRNCEFIDNTSVIAFEQSSSGGGTNGPIDHIGCLFLRNAAYSGGGSARGTYEDCEFVENVCTNQPGLAATPLGSALFSPIRAEGCTFIDGIGYATVVGGDLSHCVFYDGEYYPRGGNANGCTFLGSSLAVFDAWFGSQPGSFVDCHFSNGIGRVFSGCTFQFCTFEGAGPIAVLGGSFDSCEFTNGGPGAQISPEIQGCLTSYSSEPSFKDCQFSESCPGDPESWSDLGGNVFSGSETSSCPLDPCWIDFTNDGIIDAADLGILLEWWGSPTHCDVDHDGMIRSAELGEILARWGPCP